MRTDIAIVGGGPAGLSAAVNAVARGKSVSIMSTGDTNLEKAETVDNYLGFYKITGAEIIKRFEEHVNALGVTVQKGRVSNIMPMGNGFLINFGGEVYESSAVILATGIAKARRIPGEAELLGRGVSYCATCDGMLYRGKKAVVWGLARDAVEETNFLYDIGVSVSLIARGERPPDLKPDIPFISGAVGGIIGTGEVKGVEADGNTVDADAVFILRDSIAPAALIPELEIKDGYIKVNNKAETNIPGLFAAGDCTGAPLQIAKAVGEGLIAAQQAAKYIDALLKLKERG